MPLSRKTQAQSIKFLWARLGCQGGIFQGGHGLAAPEAYSRDMAWDPEAVGGQSFLQDESHCTHHATAVQHCLDITTLRETSCMSRWAPMTHICLIFVALSEHFPLNWAHLFHKLQLVTSNKIKWSVACVCLLLWVTPAPPWRLPTN